MFPAPKTKRRYVKHSLLTVNISIISMPLSSQNSFRVVGLKKYRLPLNMLFSFKWYTSAMIIMWSEIDTLFSIKPFIKLILSNYRFGKTKHCSDYQRSHIAVQTKQKLLLSQALKNFCNRSFQLHHTVFITD